MTCPSCGAVVDGVDGPLWSPAQLLVRAYLD